MAMWQALVTHLTEFEHTYGMQVIIKDYIGFLEHEDALLESLQPFYTHQAPYCMAIKSNRRLWDCCLYQKKAMHGRLNQVGHAFYGVCYAGVGEYVMPIWYKDQVIGSLNIGPFKDEKHLLAIKRLAKRQHLSEASLTQVYETSTTVLLRDLDWLDQRLNLIADYISLKFESQIRQALANQPNKDHHYLVAHAIAYIKAFFNTEVTLEKVAAFCHCSPSTMSHQFKTKTGMTIPYYVNQERVQQAKAHLKNGKLSITEVAYAVGFKDSNYFSTVFKRIEGCNPRDYEKGERYV